MPREPMPVLHDTHRARCPRSNKLQLYLISMIFQLQILEMYLLLLVMIQKDLLKMSLRLV